MSDRTTRGVRVIVTPSYHPEHSDPSAERWFFSYEVTVLNAGDEPVQLLTRRWVITDANGREQLVEGPGVVGETPRLEPGEGFRYTSFCPLPTSMGSMHGSYGMVTDDGEHFDALIDPFFLADPATVN